MGKRILIICMYALMLNGLTEIHQLIRLPLLIQHFLHHQKENSSLSFIDFLKIHYSNKEHPNDNDDKEDNELPFKSTGDISHVDIPVMVKRLAVANFYFQEKPSASHPEGIPNHKSFSIFHPPRTT